VRRRCHRNCHPTQSARSARDPFKPSTASAVDRGPQALSIAIARMAATCGVGLNCAMASAVNVLGDVLGDVHGGAGEQVVEL
jgi:citrate synthase